ncbi:hypothetical protein BGZ96_009276 [Linnemannia gamsii]|uniref:PAS domain-containing protein n=1 Tax=Linnemannia gamsii TaxID=64522 RepID=A0ABQ7JWJ8_9FUNG|nr:hypothetical protein BGZ96_009276 [Linnemannia gamsii]
MAHPASNEEEKALRLERARLAIERITGYDGQRLLMNTSRQSNALHGANLLDDPALTPTLTAQFASPVQPWYIRLWHQLDTNLLEHAGVALFVEFIPVVGPCFSLWFGYKLVYSNFNRLKFNDKRYAELEHAVVRPMTKELLTPQAPGEALGITLTKILSRQHAFVQYSPSPTAAMPPYLTALLASQSSSNRMNKPASGAPQLEDEEKETFPMTLLYVNRAIIDILGMPEVAVGSTTGSAASATSSLAATSTTLTASSGPEIISTDAGVLEVSDTTQYQFAEDHALIETDSGSSAEHYTPSAPSDLFIPLTSRLNLVPVEKALSSSYSTTSFSTESSSPLLIQERATVIHPRLMTTSTEFPEAILSARLRDLSIRMIEAGPTHAKSSEVLSESINSPAAMPSDSSTASTSSTSSSTLSMLSVTPARPRHRTGLLQVPTFATAGRLQFSSSNESSSDEGNEDYAGHDEAAQGETIQGEACQEKEAYNEMSHGGSPGSGNQQDVHQDDSPADGNNSHHQQEVSHLPARNDDPEDNDGIPRDEFDYKIVRPVIRLRRGYQLRSCHHEDLFQGFDSVSNHLGDHDRQHQHQQAQGMEGVSLERDAMHLDALGLGVSSPTSEPLGLRNLDPRGGIASARQCPQDAEARNAGAASVDLGLGIPLAMTHAGEIGYGFAQVGGSAQGYNAHVQNGSHAPRAEETQAFVGATWDKAEIKDEDQDNERYVKAQVVPQYGGQWQLTCKRAQRPTLIPASQDRRESILSTPPPLHPPPLPPLPLRPLHRPLTILKKFFRISSVLGSMKSTSSASHPPPPPQQPYQQHQQPRSFTHRQLATQKQHANQQYFRQSLDFREAPTYHQHLAATSTDNLSSEVSVPLASSNRNLIPSIAPLTTTTNTSTDAGGEWLSNPALPTDQQRAVSLLLCAPFIPQFDSDDDDRDITPVVAERVPNSRIGHRLPFQNQTNHQATFEGQRQHQQQQILGQMLPPMSRSLHHRAPSCVHLGSAGTIARPPPKAGAGVTFGLGEGTGRMMENRFPRTMEPAHIFGQRLIQQEIAAVRSWHARHEQNHMSTSRDNVVTSTLVPSLSSIQQPLQNQQPQQAQPQQSLHHHQPQQTQSQQPLQYQQQLQLPLQYNEEQRRHYHHNHQLQQILQPRYQPQYLVQHQEQGGGNHPFQGEMSTYDPTEDLDGDNGVDADAAFMFARQFQDPHLQLQQQQPQLQPHHQSTTTNSNSNGVGNHYGGNGGLLAPPLQPWLINSTSSSQYASSRTIHPRLLLQQQEQLRQEIHDQRVQRQQQVRFLNHQYQLQQQFQQQHLVPNQSGFDFEQQHTPQPISSQNADNHLELPSQQLRHQQAAQITLPLQALETQKEQRQLSIQLQIQEGQRETMRQLQRDSEAQSQEQMARAQRQEEARRVIALAQQIQAQQVQAVQVQQQAHHELQVRAQQVQVLQVQELQGLQGQWQGRGGLRQTGTGGQVPLPSLLTDEQNRQLDQVLYGGDKQELDEELDEGK